MSGIRLGENTKNVTINGVDVTRVGDLIFNIVNDRDDETPGATASEKYIANLVSHKVIKMRIKGYFTQDIARHAKQMVIELAQRQSAKATLPGLPDESTPVDRPPVREVQRPIHRDEPA